MKISNQELKTKVENLLKQLNNPNCMEAIIKNHPAKFENTLWSKDIGYSLLPLYFECMGFKGSKYYRKKPNKLSYLYEYKLLGDDISKVIANNKNGEHYFTLYIFKNENFTYEIEADIDNNCISIIELEHENNIPISGLKVNDENHYWYFEYRYLHGKLKEICYNAYNSNEGIMHVDYIDNTVREIYYIDTPNRHSIYKI